MLIRKLALLLSFALLFTSHSSLSQESTTDDIVSASEAEVADELGDEIRNSLIQLLGSTENTADRIDETLVRQILSLQDINVTEAQLDYFMSNMNVFVAMMKLLIDNPTGFSLTTVALAQEELSGLASEVVTIATILFPSDAVDIYLVGTGYLSLEDAQLASVAGGADPTELLAATAANNDGAPLTGGTLVDGPSEGGITPSAN